MKLAKAAKASKPSKSPKPAGRATPPPITHEAIAERARLIWQRKGGPQGQDERIWLEAEGELLRDQVVMEEHTEDGFDADGDVGARGGLRRGQV